MRNLHIPSSSGTTARRCCGRQSLVQSLANRGEQCHDGVGVETGGVDGDGVGSRLERCDVAVGVALIALLLLREEFLERHVDLAGGEIILPAPGPTLSEEAAFEALGLPRDLNGDSMIDDRDHSDDYQVLPVLIRIEWQGKSGSRRFEMNALFANLTSS